MPVLFRSLAAGTALALASVTAFAAGDHDHAHDHKPLHGGVVTEVRDVDYELVVQPTAAQLYLRDHGKQVNVSNAKAKLTLLTGSQKQEVQLTPAADGSRLEAAGPSPRPRTRRLSSRSSAAARSRACGSCCRSARCGRQVDRRATWRSPNP